MYRDHLAKSPMPGATGYRWALAAVATGVLGLVLIFEFAGRRPAPGRRQAAAALLFPFAAPDSPRLKPAEPASGLLGEAGGDALSFDEFMGYLEEASRDPALAPAAKEFVKAFEENPELKKLHKRFKDASAAGSGPGAVAFVDALRAEPAFRQLVARFLGGPQSTAFFASSKFPELGELAKAYQEARGATARVEAPRASPGGRPPTFDEARKSTLKAATAPSDPKTSGGLSARGPSVEGTAAGATAARAGAPPSAAPGGDPAAPEGRVGSPGGPGAGGQRLASATTIKDVKQIGGKEQAAELLNRYPYLAKSFSPAELGRLAEDIGRYGLWGACFAGGWFARCLEACRAAPAFAGQPTCTPVPGWEACMNAFGDAGRCIGLCKSQPPCQVDSTVWAAYCSDPSVQPPPRECSQAPAASSPSPAQQPYRGKCVQDGYGTCCFSASGALLLPPGTSYDRWPPATAPCSASGLAETGRCSEGNGTCCWSEAGAVLYTSIPDANVYPEPAVPPSCRQAAPPWRQDGLPFYCERRAAAGASLECCFRAKDGAFVRVRPNRGAADVDACLRPPDSGPAPLAPGQPAPLLEPAPGGGGGGRGEQL